MSEAKHTPEPWSVHSKRVWTVEDDCGDPVAGTFAREEVENIANSSRIVACVNAMAGIDDPAAWVKGVKAALKPRAKWTVQATGDVSCVSSLIEEPVIKWEGDGKVEVVCNDNDAIIFYANHRGKWHVNDPTGPLWKGNGKAADLETAKACCIAYAKINKLFMFAEPKPKPSKAVSEAVLVAINRMDEAGIPEDVTIDLLDKLITAVREAKNE